MIAGYIGGRKIGKTMCRFTKDYADQTDRDHDVLLLKPVARGVAV